MIYDYIIAGAGLGGLSFAHHLIHSQRPFERILIIDRDDKKTNDRTWSFWSEEQPEYHCAHGQHWEQLGFISNHFSKFENINPFKYYTIDGLSFYEEVRQEISKDSRFHWLKADVKHISSHLDDGVVSTNLGLHHGQVVIDSISRPKLDDNHSINVWQSFLGWTIQTHSPLFDPDKPILMDFRVTQAGAASFVYVLPYSPNHALVEYTQFTSTKSIDKEAYARALNQYLKRHWGLTDFGIEDEEIGQIPMTNHEFNPHPSERVHRLGTAGGDTKPTTGYTFTNVQSHVKAILNEQVQTREDKTRFAFYDTLLLQIIQQKPEQVKPIMEYLFKSQPFTRVLRFLDETTHPLEEMMIFGQLPWAPFINSLTKKWKHDYIG